MEKTGRWGPTLLAVQSIFAAKSEQVNFTYRHPHYVLLENMHHWMRWLRSKYLETFQQLQCNPGGHMTEFLVLHCLVSTKGHVYMPSASVVSNSVWPYRLQPSGLLCPWGFSRREYWSVLPCPSPGDLPDPGIRPVSLLSSELLADSLYTETPGIQFIHYLRNYTHTNNTNSSKPLAQYNFPSVCVVFNYFHQCFTIFQVHIFYLLT